MDVPFMRILRIKDCKIAFKTTSEDHRRAFTYYHWNVTEQIEMERICLGFLMALFFTILPVPADAQLRDGLATPLAATPLPEIAIYRSESCGCCTKWAEHVAAAGFPIQDKVINAMDAFKQANGITEELASCHTAIVDGYVVEGHVPAASIKKMLHERPDIRGLAAPGMPMGSPGMETAGVSPEAFDVLAIAQDGTATVFDPIRPQ
jgi:hypothetical protein